LLTTAGLLAIGSAAVFPFEIDTVVSLSQNRLVATHYGFYNTIVGIGILIGNLATGSIMQVARGIGHGELVWLILGVVGILAAFALYSLDRAGLLQPAPTAPSTVSN